MNGISTLRKRLTDVFDNDSITPWSRETSDEEARACEEKRRVALEKLNDAVIMMFDD